MRFDFTDNDKGVLISGEFTFTDHGAFLEVSKRLFATPPNQAILIDLSKLNFIDSAGLGMLLIARDAAAKANRKLILRGAAGQVSRMFTVTKFDALFTIEA